MTGVCNSLPVRRPSHSVHPRVSVVEFCQQFAEFVLFGP